MRWSNWSDEIKVRLLGQSHWTLGKVIAGGTSRDRFKVVAVDVPEVGGRLAVHPVHGKILFLVHDASYKCYRELLTKQLYETQRLHVKGMIPPRPKHGTDVSRRKRDKSGHFLPEEDTIM